MNKVIINHTLHGYKQGHSLIESSILINSDIKRNLMIMSDMSGSSMLNGFEEYITGYPLKEMNMYAIAKTWNAPEMKRPGCVWTHTLLINFSDLFYLNDYLKIKQLFKRPDEDVDLDYYSKPSEITIEETSSNPLNTVNNYLMADFSKEVIYQLYAKNNNSILIQSPNSEQFEILVLSIWLQQWPRLKRNFAFCTGAISARLLNNRLLDLQIIPLKNDRNIAENENVVVLNPNNSYSKEFEKWVEILYDDLSSQSSQLKNFFKTYGADIREDKTVIKPLVELYKLLRNNEDLNISERIESIAKYFPSYTDAASLKKTLLFNTVFNQYSNFIGDNEEAVLCELASTQYFSSFDYVSLEFTEKFKSLFINNRKCVFDIFNYLISKNINSYGEEVFKIIAESIDVNDIELLNKNYRKLFLIFLGFNVQLAYNRKTWELNTASQNENLYVLSKINNVDWHKIIINLLEVNAEFDKDVLFHNNIDVINPVLDWVNYNGNNNLNTFWFGILNSKQEVIIEWVKNNSSFNTQILKIISQILNPNSKIVLECNTKIWLKLILSGNLFWNLNEELRFKAFMLAIAFNKSEENILPLFVFSFEQIYKAALHDKLDYYSWKIIEVHTKPLPYWKEWDKCKKLRNALIEKFFELHWPIENLDSIFYDRAILEQMYLKYIKFKSKR